ncbi:hypothetical protein ABKV19_026756 [Rosa sericea]
MPFRFCTSALAIPFGFSRQSFTGADNFLQMTPLFSHSHQFWPAVITLQMNTIVFPLTPVLACSDNPTAGGQKHGKSV